MYSLKFENKKCINFIKHFETLLNSKKKKETYNKSSKTFRFNAMQSSVAAYE